MFVRNDDLFLVFFLNSFLGIFESLRDFCGEIKKYLLYYKKLLLSKQNDEPCLDQPRPHHLLDQVLLQAEVQLPGPPAAQHGLNQLQSNLSLSVVAAPAKKEIKSRNKYLMVILINPYSHGLIKIMRQLMSVDQSIVSF